MTVVQDGNANRSKRRGKKVDGVGLQQVQADENAAALACGLAIARNGRGGGTRGAVVKSSKEIVHHHPPKEMAADVGYPVRGGQTLLIAYFPWEASEADIEHEFAKFCRVKRVHLVVDKSSRKPRCFGFVKFMGKADAEEALRATTQGYVQLPDTRGHIWHLKAEWTKSGDMVVDDSETEQEVAKRKEERRYRAEQRGGTTTNAIAEGTNRTPQSKSGKLSSAPLKGALHPGVPAPLPPLQPRYPTTPTSLGLQPLYGGMQQGLPVYNGQQQGQALYGAPSAGPPSYSGLAGGVAPPLPRDSCGGGIPTQCQAVQNISQDGSAQQVIRDLGSSSSYSSAPQGYTNNQQGYPPNQQGYAAQAQGYAPQPQGYVAGQPGYAAGQQPYVASQQAYVGSQQAYAANQQGYVSGQHGYAQPQSGYASQPQGYPPQSQAYTSQQHGTGYASSPPGYSSQSHGYTQSPSYPSAHHPSYGNYNMGQAQQNPPGVSPQTSAQPGPYGYLQQPGAPPYPGVVAYGSYPNMASQVPTTQPLLHPSDDASQNTSSAQSLPAPPEQQPPAPPAGTNDWDVGPRSVVVTNSSGSSGPAAVWNSFDDAAAKGMVDGLVGGEDGAAPSITTWTTQTA